LRDGRKSSFTRDQKEAALIKGRDNNGLQHTVFAYGGFKIFEISKIFTRLLWVPFDIKDPDLRQTRSIVRERVETKRSFSFSDSLKSGF
jgi:hypothetical protein